MKQYNKPRTTHNKYGTNNNNTNKAYIIKLSIASCYKVYRVMKY